MTSAIQPYQGNQIIRTMDDAERAAKAMATSGFFKDSSQLAQAVVKILAGQELGFGPFASMNGIHIIQGRPSYSANIMAAAVKKSGRYNYRVIEMTDAACEIAFFEGGQEIGRSKFTKEDAVKAQTQNMNKFPRNMLFARAMSNGVKWYCPDVFNGSAVYTPEELGAQVNEEGEIIEGTSYNPPTNGNGEPLPVEQPAAPVMTLDYAMNCKTQDKRLLSSLTVAELEEQLNKARKVDPAKRTDAWQRAYTAIEMVLEYREREDEAAREAENE